MLSAPTNPVVVIDKHQFYKQPLEVVDNSDIINDKNFSKLSFGTMI